MKSLAATIVLVATGVVFACAVEPTAPDVPPSAGGAGGATTGGTGGMTGGTGGMTGGTGGATGGTGGATGGTGGATGGTGGATGGSAGVGTGGATGGSAGAGGATGGSAGVATGGSAGDGSGGSAGSDAMGGASGSGQTGGSAGMSGAGGSSGGMSGAGGSGAGTAGAGGSAGKGGGGVPTITELVGNLDGHLIITPCGDQPSSDDCAGGGWRSSAVDAGANHACANGRLEAIINFPVGGTDGVEYDVLMHFYGVMEPRQYSNVMREAQGATNRTGGTPTGWATATGNASVYSTGDNNYNTYEIRVSDQNDMPVAQYFMNSDSGTGHYTMITNYEKTITLIGGGSVRLRVYDANCREIKNCGANGGSGAACATNARSVDVSAAMPQPGSMPPLMQPGLGLGSQYSGQWWLIDVKSVALGT